MDNDIYESEKVLFADTIATCLLRKTFLPLDAEQTKALALSEGMRLRLIDGDTIVQRHEQGMDGFVVAIFHRGDNFYIGACTLKQSEKDFLERIRQFGINRHFPLV